MQEYAICERRIDCPYCAAPVTLLLDLSAGSQSYVEDCQVCCQPMQVEYEVDDGFLTAIEVGRDG